MLTDRLDSISAGTSRGLERDSRLCLSTYITKKNGQSRTLRKRQLMWRSIILSTFINETYLPYCSYIRYLDLYDLDELVRDDEFKTSFQE